MQTILTSSQPIDAAAPAAGACTISYRAYYYGVARAGPI